MLEEAVVDWIVQYGYESIFVLLLLGIVGLPVPDETLLSFAGYFAHRGDLSLIPTYIAAFFGSVSGITISYLLGRTLGLKLILRYGARVRITPERMEKAHAWFERLGKWTLVIGYFLPGIRHFTALTAGATKLEARHFCLFAYLGALLWTSSFITLGYSFGKVWTDLSARIQIYLIYGTLIALGLAAVYFLTVQARRRLR